jgi:ABC-type iron transport system FetAB ATPase subunit
VSKARIMPDLTNGASTLHDQSKNTQMQHIWVVTGPAGCGKSTAGNVLRTHLGVPFLEGDDVSTEQAIESNPTHHCDNIYPKRQPKKVNNKLTQTTP